MLLAIIDQNISLFPYEWDDYYVAAMGIKDNIKYGYPLFYNINYSLHVSTYSLYSSFVLWLFGDHEIIIRILNCFLNVLAAERIYRLSREIFGFSNRASFITLCMFCFWPSFLIFSGLNMRDSLIVFLSVEVLYRFAVYIKLKNGRNLLIAVPTLLILLPLRVQNILLYLLILYLYWFLQGRLSFSLKNIKPSRAIFLIGFLIIIVIILGDDFNNLFLYLNAEMRGRASGGSAYAVGNIYESWFDILLWSPIRFIYFTFGPFIWQVNNAFMLFASFESMLLLILSLISFHVIRRHQNLRNSRVVVLVIVFCLLGLLSNAVVDSNYGTAIRHRMNYIFVFFILSSNYFEKLRIQLA
jgi:hypothetical protein